MPPDLDRRTYDLLRLVDHHGPIGSIQLVELMQLHGYSIKDRTIRLTLSELDELGLTEKVPGKGRRLTEKGRRELGQGDVSSRLEQIHARISTLTSRVSYDPIEDTGVLVACAAFLDADEIGDGLALVERLESLPFGPIPIALEESTNDEPGDYRLLSPSSITLNGVLLARGINTKLTTAGVVEYDADGASNRGGRIARYVDVITGKGSSIDVISLLIEAGRSDVESVLDGGGSGLVVGDDREFPINRFEEARDLTLATRAALGGAVDLRRPREKEQQFPNGDLAWASASITYVGSGELVLTALSEYGLSSAWQTLYGTVTRNEFESCRTARGALEIDE